MNRLLGIVAVCALGGLFFYFYSRTNTAEADPLQDFATWAPGPAELQREVAAVPKGASSAADTVARRNKFAELMTRRFREHNEGMAVRVRFRSDSLIDLLCPARMEPWNIDRMAMNIWHEANTDLGRRYDINLFRTYIGTPPIRVGELRNQAGQPEKVGIRYYGLAVAQKSGAAPGSGANGAPGGK